MTFQVDESPLRKRRRRRDLVPVAQAAAQFGAGRVDQVFDLGLEARKAVERKAARDVGRRGIFGVERIRVEHHRSAP